MQPEAIDNTGCIGPDELNLNENNRMQYSIAADPMGSAHSQLWARYWYQGLTRTAVRQRISQEAFGSLLGSVPIPLAMIESITSSVPPPMETSLPSRNRRDTGLSHI